jgi:hypothetical protein
VAAGVVMAPSKGVDSAIVAVMGLEDSTGFEDEEGPAVEVSNNGRVAAFGSDWLRLSDDGPTSGYLV